MEMVMGAIKAGEELHSPIILQVAEGRLRYSPLYLIGPAMITAAEAATIPVVVHLDHGAQCVSEMALADFRGSEVGNKYPKNTENLEKSLQLRGIEIASAWFSSFLTVKPFEEVALAFKEHRDFLYEMGAKVVVVSEQGHSIQGQLDMPIFAKKPHFSEEEWKKLAEGLNQLGELAQEKGMKVVYHHHMGTGVQTAKCNLL